MGEKQIKTTQAVGLSEVPTKINKFSLKIFNKCLFFVIIIFGISYLLCINDLAIKGFKLNELKTNYNKLNAEKDKYELDIMAYKSFNNLAEKAKTLKLTAVAAPEYIDVASMSVATNK